MSVQACTRLSGLCAAAAGADVACHGWQVDEEEEGAGKCLLLAGTVCWSYCFDVRLFDHLDHQVLFAGCYGLIKTWLPCHGSAAKTPILQCETRACKIFTCQTDFWSGFLSEDRMSHGTLQMLCDGSLSSRS